MTATETAPITCARCGLVAAPPPPHRVPFTGPDKDRVLGTICADCWKLWEAMEVKVLNEYRLNFMDPQHRTFLQKACTDFLFEQKAQAEIPE
jgi:Fe-S cluster biosynthesis and repair protein YggX